jgi:lactase-phlorizin hydrolase
MPLDDSPENILASERHAQFSFGWFGHPIAKNGDYPELMKEAVGIYRC